MNPTTVSPTESAVHLKDGRERGWFWVENDLFTLPISCYAKLLYCGLARHANKEGASYPKVSTLVEEMGVGKTKVKEARQELQDFQLLEVRQTFNHGRQVSNTYVLIEVKEAARRLGGRVAAASQPCGDPPGGRVAATDTTKETHTKETQRKEVGAVAPAPPVSAYADRWKSKYGVTPLVTGKDAGTLARLHRRLGSEEFTTALDRYFALETDRLVREQRHPVGLFSSCINALRVGGSVETMDPKERARKDKLAREASNGRFRTWAEYHDWELRSARESKAEQEKVASLVERKR